MSTSATSICNSALIKIGAERIISLDADNDRARLCNEQYEKLRDEVLVSHPWNFAIKRAELAEDSDTPLFDFEHQYPLPSDCLRVLTTDLPSESEYAIEGRLILCNEPTLQIRYIQQVVDTSKFSKAFVEALAFRIAADIAYPITQKMSLMEDMHKLYDQFMSKARSYDSQEGRAFNRVNAVEWTNARLK
jgi:hypothetical protein